MLLQLNGFNRIAESKVSLGYEGVLGYGNTSSGCSALLHGRRIPGFAPVQAVATAETYEVSMNALEGLSRSLISN